MEIKVESLKFKIPGRTFLAFLVNDGTYRIEFNKDDEAFDIWTDFKVSIPEENLKDSKKFNLSVMLTVLDEYEMEPKDLKILAIGGE